ncbi:MAG: glycosyltransferase family 4 protein [Tepidisphaeraceae bacterium]|jgi:glycosyltransferase involved in cell wall biosynthesis
MPRRLRVAFALPGLHKVVRGAETAFEQIARHLARLGHQVTVFGSGLPRAGEPYRFSHVPCIPRERFENWPKFPLLRSHYAWEELTFAPGLMRQFRAGDFDVSVACSYPYSNWVLRLRGNFAYRRPVKHVFVTQNGDWMVQSNDAEYRLFGCDGLVCTNPQYFERHKHRYRSVLIPNGVEPDVFKPGEGDRSAYGLPADGPVALMVSALIPSKRVVEGVRAVAKVPGLFLVIAGDGQCREDLDREGRRLMAGRYRRLQLPREQMPGLYRCADVFLHMSREEPSANAYLEALATGLPVVAHDWEVTRWTLEETGVLVDTADPAAVANGIWRAIPRRESADVAARRALVERRFAWSVLAPKYAEFFLALLDANPRGAGG